MEATTEQRLIKALLNHDFYSRAKSLILDGFFEKEGKTIYKTLAIMHDKYECDVKIGDLKEYLFGTNKVTTAGRALYNNIFDAVDMEDAPNPEMSMDLLRMLHKRERAFAMGEILADIVNGKDRSFDEIRTILEGSTEDVALQIPEVTNDVEELLSWNDPKNKHSFGLKEFDDRGIVVGPGNLVGVFARPDVGKSSLCAQFAVNFARQGKRVGYFGNEEPGQKIRLNMLRCATALTDADLVLNLKRGIKQYDSWDEVKDNIVLKDVVGSSVEQLEQEIKDGKFDIVFADQIDKFNIAGSYENNTYKHKDRYVYTRELAKTYQCVMINVCQASAEAQDKRTVTYDQMDGSKTGKAGELDLAIGVGVNPGVVDDMLRVITVSKNKAGSCWKGEFEVPFNPFTNRWGNA